MDRKMIVAGNWKLNGDHFLVQDFLDGFANTSLTKVSPILCLPSVYLATVQDAKFALGAQNVSDQASGAFTGEVSVGMLKDVNAEFVIVGHSERREMFQETNEVIAKKLSTAIAAGLTPILCIGESLETRESGSMFEFLSEQLASAIAEIGIAGIDKCVIAYEPIWAIGTGLTASPEQAQEVHAFIRNFLAEHDADIAANTSILYGGSVNAASASALFAEQDIDGGLVGGASLKLKEFLEICQAAEQRG